MINVVSVCFLAVLLVLTVGLVAALLELIVRAVLTVAEGPFGLELHSGGGVWELDTGRGARRLLGRKVEVCGRRAGFNELICDQIWPAGHPRPPRSKFNIELLLAGSVVGYGLIAFFLGLVGRLG